jgi:Carotenoid biosynthesis protein
MASVDPKLSKPILAYSLAHGVVNTLWLARRWGWWNAARLGVIGAGLPALAEVWITSLDKIVGHRMKPRVLGVPLAIPLLWFNVIFSSAAATEPALAKLRLDERKKQDLFAPTTALVATSLDLIMDCFGLDQGLWEWNLDGPYAAEIEGANGRNGIPLLNFFGWIFLVATIVLLCQSLTRTEDDQQPRRQSGFERLPVLMLVPYYLVSAIWAIKKRRPRYLLYSMVLPASLVAALWNR